MVCTAEEPGVAMVMITAANPTFTQPWGTSYFSYEKNIDVNHECPAVNNIIPLLTFNSY